MKQKTYTILETGSPKSEVKERIKINDVKTISDAKVFLIETIQDFNTYDLTKKECLDKLEQYTDKIIEITQNELK